MKIFNFYFILRVVFLLRIGGVAYSNDFFEEYLINFSKRYRREFCFLELLERDQVPHSVSFYQNIPGICVILSPDKSYEKQLIQSAPDNVIFLCSSWNVQKLKKLNECEHFDFVVYRPKTFNEALLKVISLLGNYVLILDNHSRCMDFFKGEGLNVHSYMNILLISNNNKKELKRRTWVWPPPYVACFTKKKHYIISDFEKIMFYKSCGNQILKTSWVSGINLLTFKCLNGIYPLIDLLKRELLKLPRVHNDWKISNMVLSGNKVCMIDEHDLTVSERNRFSQKRLDQALRILCLNEEKSIYDYFWANDRLI